MKHPYITNRYHLLPLNIVMHIVVNVLDSTHIYVSIKYHSCLVIINREPRRKQREERNKRNHNNQEDEDYLRLSSSPINQFPRLGSLVAGCW